MMSVTPLLVVLSGPAQSENRLNALAFHTTANNLSFTSCSGILLSAHNSTNHPTSGFVLLPASAVKPWLHPDSPWPPAQPQPSPEPPPLPPGCVISWLGPAGNTGTCTPIATLTLPAAAAAASQLLRGLNRGAPHAHPSTALWSLTWAVATDPSGACSPMDLASMVLCWAQPTGEDGAAPDARGGGPCPLPTLPPAPAAATAAPSSASCLSPSAACSTTVSSPNQPQPNSPPPPVWLPDLRRLHSALSAPSPATSCTCSTATATSTAGPPAGSCPADAAAGCPAGLPARGCGAAGRCRAPEPAPPPPAHTAPACHRSTAPHMDPGCRHAEPQPRPQPGQRVAVVGSPFGCLAPFHFAHAQVSGVVSVVFPHPAAHPAAPARSPVAAPPILGPASGGDAGEYDGGGAGGPALLALDAAVLPGMEGGLVGPLQEPRLPLEAQAWGAGGCRCFGGDCAAALVPYPCTCRGCCGGGGGAAALPLALLATPLRRRADGVQIPLALPWRRVAAGLYGAVTALLTPHGAAAASDAAGGGPPRLLQLQPLSAATHACAQPHTGHACVRLLAQRHTHAHPPERVHGPCGCTLGAGPAPQCGPSVAQLAAGPPACARQAVVLLRYDGSWATGVVIAPCGLVITAGHLFRRSAGGGAASGGGAAGSGPGSEREAREQGEREWRDAVCWARVPWVGAASAADRPAAAATAAAGWEAGGAPGDPGGGGGGEPYMWLRARVLYCWSNHLDLAVLQLEPPYGVSLAGRGGRRRLALAAVQQVACAEEDAAAVPAGGAGGDAVVAAADAPGTYGVGTAVWAVGHSLVGPAAGWPAGVSYGCVAQVLRTPAAGRPTLLIATAATHAGGSGGALLDAAGRLVGLATSNARHGPSGATLPRLAFAVAAEELRAVVGWAARFDAAGEEASGGAAALRALDVRDEDADRIWRLQAPRAPPPPPPPPQPQPQPQHRQDEGASTQHPAAGAAADASAAAAADTPPLAAGAARARL